MRILLMAPQNCSGTTSLGMLRTRNAPKKKIYGLENSRNFHTHRPSPPFHLRTRKTVKYQLAQPTYSRMQCDLRQRKEKPLVQYYCSNEISRTLQATITMLRVLVLVTVDCRPSTFKHSGGGGYTANSVVRRSHAALFLLQSEDR